ncbi:hypothetical protein E2542_SST16662 [Spatholobus suberectus]|nr:hypothetical protein E2542_SST16662 [Spatholobus suberectus]
MSSVRLQQSVVGSQEERVAGLPSSFLNWRRACLSCGLHTSESAGVKASTMSRRMLKRDMVTGILIRSDLCVKTGRRLDVYILASRHVSFEWSFVTAHCCYILLLRSMMEHEEAAELEGSSRKTRVRVGRELEEDATTGRKHKQTKWEVGRREI